MRVLMLGENVASQMSVTVRALRAIGVEAEGIIYSQNPIYGNDGLRNLAHGLSRRERLRHGYLRTSLTWSVSAGIARADVVHWNYGIPVSPDAREVRLARCLGRPGAVEFWGSDVRIPKFAEQDNPYYARRGAAYEYELDWTEQSSYQRQRLFARNGVTTAFAPPWFDRYVEPGLFRQVHASYLRLLPEQFPARLGTRARRPVVAHAPSAKGAKGTDAVLRCVERLRERFEFDFVLLHGLPREQSLAAVADCDVFLDQFVIGEYGMASIEAMAYGKPVVCYLRPDVIARSPGSIPIVNATQDDLEDRVAELIADAALRRRIGEASRAHVELHHDALKYAARLASIYEGMMRHGPG